MSRTPFKTLLAGPLAALLLGLAACSDTHVEPPVVQGPPAMVNHAGQSRLWVLSRQEEVHTVGVGFSHRTSGNWRTDTFFHFQVQAFDPETARPVWTQRLLTYGDPEAAGTRPSRVIGSSVDGRLLGQDGDLVWLLIDQSPWAVNAADGTPVADAGGLEQRNAELRGLLPSDGKHYGFDQGLVLMTADARRFVVRGPTLEAEPYVPAPPPAPPPDRHANGRERVVPMLPMGEVPARLVQLDGQWLGLYSEKEAADAANDEFGDRFRYPYSVLDEGPLARRTFWRPRIVATQRFDDKYDRFESLQPIPDAPGFLRGRLFKDLATGQAMRMASPTGLLVWHSTRIDSAGRLALTRLDSALRTIWSTALPLSENSTSTPVRYWQLPGRVLVVGVQQSVDDGVQQRTPYLVTISLADGSMQAWNMTQEQALP